MSRKLAPSSPRPPGQRPGTPPAGHPPTEDSRGRAPPKRVQIDTLRRLLRQLCPNQTPRQVWARYLCEVCADAPGLTLAVNQGVLPWVSRWVCEPCFGMLQLAEPGTRRDWMPSRSSSVAHVLAQLRELGGLP